MDGWFAIVCFHLWVNKMFHWPQNFNSEAKLHLNLTMNQCTKSWMWSLEWHDTFKEFCDEKCFFRYPLHKICWQTLNNFHFYSCLLDDCRSSLVPVWIDYKSYPDFFVSHHLMKEWMPRKVNQGILFYIEVFRTDASIFAPTKQKNVT